MHYVTIRKYGIYATTISFLIFFNLFSFFFYLILAFDANVVVNTLFILFFSAQVDLTSSGNDATSQDSHSLCICSDEFSFLSNFMFSIFLSISLYGSQFLTVVVVPVVRSFLRLCPFFCVTLMYMREISAQQHGWLSVALYNSLKCGEVIRLRQGPNIFEFSDILLEISRAYETKNDEGKKST